MPDANAAAPPPSPPRLPAVGSFAFTLVVAWAMFATVASIALGIGWWSTRAELDQVGPPPSRGEGERPGMRRGTPPHAGRDESPLTLPSPGAGEGREAETTTPADTPEATPTGAPCPHCGRGFDPVVTGTPPGGPKPEPAAGASAKSASRPPSPDGSWPPRSLADLPGATLREKITALIDSARDQAGDVSRDDVLRVAKIRDPVEEILEEAGQEDASGLPRVLLDLFQSERNELLAELIGTKLCWPVLKDATAEEKAEHERLLAELSQSTDPLERRKSLQGATYLRTPEALERWRIALAADPDAGVRAAAAEERPIGFPEARSLLLQAAQYDPDPGVRANGVQSLAHGATQEEFRAMLALLRREPEFAVQKSILWTFQLGATTRDTEVRDALLEIGRDPQRPIGLRIESLNVLRFAGSGGLIQDPILERELGQMTLELMKEQALQRK
ncbi:MAG: hypothetical protein HYY93_01280 [Planctomycetes bacterium]|nr:hypothetical protein [Planctomycetota bacterium]